MVARVNGAFASPVAENVVHSRVLVVGAGGIGCELLKNLVLTGFQDITLIDLDTIDVSNLNRQFLFRKEHVGKSKAKIARESVLQLNPECNIVAHHANIMSPEFDVNFFKGFSIVMNALDNRAARNHVNRMCLAADIPLVESGSAGYLGQVTVIKKGISECYECRPKPAAKTFPGCTIRNTPSEMSHCVVWAKHLFNQLFGEDDPDQDVSPDAEDPEMVGEAGQAALAKTGSSANGDNDTAAPGCGIERKSTRAWAFACQYAAEKLFTKFFRDDIKYLLSMDNLWKKRRPPQPLDWKCLPDVEHEAPGLPADRDVQHHGAAGSIKDQQMWSVKQCSLAFADSLDMLRLRLSDDAVGGDVGDNVLVWDKDDDVALDFVTSAANLRAYIFKIPMQTRFDIKSIAGNIIPAIASTNAVVAGLQLMEVLKLLSGQMHKCKSVFISRQPNSRNKLLNACVIDKPNPKCYVCSQKPEVFLLTDLKAFTVKQLKEKVLQGELGMVAPDVEIDDGKGTILISSEPGETDTNEEHSLGDFDISSGARLKCDDFLQSYNLVVIVQQARTDQLEDEKEYKIVGDLAQFQASAQDLELPSQPSTDPAVVRDLMIDDEIIEDNVDAEPQEKMHSSEDVPQTKRRRMCSSDDCIIVVNDVACDNGVVSGALISSADDIGVGANDTASVLT